MEDLRRFTLYGEKRAGTNNKFYEVEAQEREDGQADYTFRWGRIGTSGQEKKNTTWSFDAARDACQAQFDKKRGRGYNETNAMEALASAIQEPEERKTDGLPAIDLTIPSFGAGKSEARCHALCKKWLGKLNIVRKSKNALGYKAYRSQIEAVLEGFCKECVRVRKTKAHGHLSSNTKACKAFGSFLQALRDNAGINVYRSFSAL